MKEKNINLLIEIAIENLILHKRFESVEDIEKVLSSFLDKEIKLRNSTLEINYVDYSLIVDLTENENYAYLEFYYLKMRNNWLYVTEVNYTGE